MGCCSTTSLASFLVLRYTSILSSLPSRPYKCCWASMARFHFWYLDLSPQYSSMRTDPKLLLGLVHSWSFLTLLFNMDRNSEVQEPEATSSGRSASSSPGSGGSPPGELGGFSFWGVAGFDHDPKLAEVPGTSAAVGCAVGGTWVGMWGICGICKNGFIVGQGHGEVIAHSIAACPCGYTWGGTPWGTCECQCWGQGCTCGIACAAIVDEKGGYIPLTFGGWNPGTPWPKHPCGDDGMFRCPGICGCMVGCAPPFIPATPCGPKTVGIDPIVFAPVDACWVGCSVEVGGTVFPFNCAPLPTSPSPPCWFWGIQGSCPVVTHSSSGTGVATAASNAAGSLGPKTQNCPQTLRYQ